HVTEIVDEFELCENAAAECDFFAQCSDFGRFEVDGRAHEVLRSVRGFAVMLSIRKEKSWPMALSCSLIASALTDPILNGAVAAPALDLTITTATVDENSRAMIAGKFDVAEMSMATFVQARDRGMDFVALP